VFPSSTLPVSCPQASQHIEPCFFLLILKDNLFYQFHILSWSHSKPYKQYIIYFLPCTSRKENNNQNICILPYQNLICLRSDATFSFLSLNLYAMYASQCSGFSYISHVKPCRQIMYANIPLSWHVLIVMSPHIQQYDQLWSDNSALSQESIFLS